MKSKATNIITTGIVLALPIAIYKFNILSHAGIAFKVLLGLWLLCILAMFTLKLVVYRKLKKQISVTATEATPSATKREPEVAL